MSENPYQTPLSNPLGRDTEISGRFGPVRDISLLAKFSKAMLIVNIILSIVYGLFIFWSLDFMGGSNLGDFNSISAYLEFLMLLSIASVIVFVLTVIVICMWTTKAMANTWSFGKPTITPGWAAGWYFIPVANFWKPYEAVKQMWEGVYGSKKSKKLLLVWWWCWAGVMLTDSINLSLQRMSINVSLSLRLTGIHEVLSVSSCVLTIISSVCFIKVISDISGAQNSKLAKLYP